MVVRLSVRLVLTLELVNCKDLFLQLAICVPLDVVPLVFGLWGNSECFACYLDHQAVFDYYLQPGVSRCYIP